jgi:uncharacterized protein (DUF305 family)
MKMRRFGPFLCAALVVAACSTEPPSESAAQHALASDRPGMDDSGGVAPSRLVVDGQYSDRRFLDMMAAHHAMAVAMARLALDHIRHPELREIVRKTIDAQGAEIEEMRDIKRQTYGSAELPREMSHEDVANSGSVMPEELDLKRADLSFIDAMTPHHAGAIEMASVARIRSTNARIAALARRIIDAQVSEMGSFVTWRRAWFGDTP